MARPTTGWKLRPPEPGRNTYTVRFSVEGKRRERSTGESDPERAAKAAERIYAAEVLGVPLEQPKADSPRKLPALLADWLAEYAVSHSDGQGENAKGYARQFVARGLELTAQGYAAYMRDRIQQITRTTLRKELSALRQFVAWCNDAPRSMGLAAVPGLPKRGHPGKRAKNARKRAAVILEPEQVEQVLAALKPAWRPFFRVCWETSLRPFATVAQLETPAHWNPAAPGRLFLAREIDKAKYERTVEVTPEAGAGLASTGATDGKLFPRLDRYAARNAWLDALRRVGLSHTKATVYDLRHSRISQWANTPGVPLAGVSFLAGHLHISTTARYVRAKEEAGRAVLAIAGAPPKPRDEP